MGLLPQPPARVAAGEVRFAGNRLTGLSDTRMQRIRGPGIAMVFQEPMTSLNPVFTIGEQVMETIRAHERLSQRALHARALEMLEKVGIPSAARRMADYPHQLSGGQRQRVMLAIALACRPRLLIADEPTTALDVTIQAQILDLMMDLRDEFGMAIIIITHNMGVVAETADRVLVMYAGRIVEDGAGRTPVRPPAAPLHARPAGVRALARSGPRAPGGDRGHAARPGAPPRRLPLRAALPLRRTGLRIRHPAACRVRAGPHRRLHPRGRSDVTPLIEAAGLTKHFRCAPAACCTATPSRCAPSTTCRCTSSLARRWAWSANPAAANPRSAAC